MALKPVTRWRAVDGGIECLMPVSPTAVRVHFNAPYNGNDAR